ncbi:MAG: HAMP domain-containing histidine kinase [Rubrivivax sp.]|nr:HAMP domain-containing histidine kinase [Rubrivivax sp.]
MLRPATAVSIRQRLSRALVMVSLAWGLSVSAVVWWVVQHEVDEIMDATLSESAQILLGVLQFERERLPLGRGQAMPAPAHDEHLVWQLVAPGAGVLLRSHQAPGEPMVPAATRGLVSVGDMWRVHASEFDASGRVLLVAQPGRERFEARVEAAEYTSGAALVVGLACALWLSRRVRRELKPIDALSAAVAHYDPLLPQAALPDPQRQELAPMHGAIIALGERLARRVANERAFAGHAAHALRTPLAGLVAQLATAQRLAPPAVQPMLRLAREAADRLRRVVTALLALFRTGTELNLQPVDLGDLLALLPTPGLQVQVTPGAQVVADPDLLAAAFANLLENAARHGAHGVTVSVSHPCGDVCISVHDDGSGMPPDRREALQAALTAQDYASHTGLGLMLADLVARAHGGGVRLPATLTGTQIDLVLGALCGPSQAETSP